MASPVKPFMLSRAVLTTDQLASIGAVAIECAYLDQTVERLILRVCGMEHDQGKYFTGTMPLDKKLDLLSDLAKQKLPAEKIGEFTQIISECKLANNDRNTIIHGIWLAATIRMSTEGRKTPDPTAEAVKLRLRSAALLFPADKVDHAAERLAEAMYQLNRFASENGLQA
jgi:hypothetical protein